MEIKTKRGSTIPLCSPAATVRYFVHVSPVGVCALVNLLLAERASSGATLGLWSPADCGARGHPISPKYKSRVRTPATAHIRQLTSQRSYSLKNRRHLKIIFIGLVCKKSSDHDSMPYAHDCCILLLKQGQLAESRAVNFVSTQEE
jgi:hypothetical protein